jgi:hypothetical protein
MARSIKLASKMKLDKKILSVSVLLGLLGGLIDTILDYAFFYKGESILDLLFFDIPSHAIYFRSVILFLFIIFGLIVGNTISRLKEALQNVKTLTGFLPICANCKKIRDDEGYWQQIEEYIMSHSEVDFTHSICNECVKKLYPEYSQKFEERMKKYPPKKKLK